MKALLALVVIVASLAAAPAYAGSHTGYRFITDTLGGNGHPRKAQPQGYTFITDTLGGNGGPSAVTVPAPGFSWGDAGVGASAAAGVIFVLLGGTLLVRRRARLAI